jgi:hypothetical protein
MTKLRWLILASFFAALVIGCKGSSNPSRVSGKVTYNGNPVTGGTITFIPAAGLEEAKGTGGGFYQTRIKPDGTYERSEMPAGEFIVTVETESMNADASAKQGKGGFDPNQMGQMNQMEEMMKKKGAVPADAGKSGGAYVKIPAKYAEKSTTPLKTTLESGKNTYSPDLTDN